MHTQALDFSVPSRKELIGDAPTEAWLASQFDLLQQSPVPSQRMAAPGLLLRLWMPPRGQSGQEFDRMLTDQDTLAPVRAWVRALAPETSRAIDILARHYLLSLHVELELCEREAFDFEAATRLLYLRDDLESACALLDYRREGKGLRELLNVFDEHAQKSPLWKEWVKHPTVEEMDRLWALSWQEIESWWGQLVVEAFPILYPDATTPDASSR